MGRLDSSLESGPLRVQSCVGRGPPTNLIGSLDSNIPVGFLERPNQDVPPCLILHLVGGFSISRATIPPYRETLHLIRTSPCEIAPTNIVPIYYIPRQNNIVALAREIFFFFFVNKF